jgi:hypothetical protein
MTLGEPISLRKVVVGLVCGLLLVVGMFLILSNLGCQVGVSGSVGGAMYYPDGAKDKELGDPRKGRYAPGNTDTEEKFNTGFKED